MLVARGGLAVGSASMRSTFLFEPKLHVHAVERSGLVFDTRLVPEVEPGRDVVVVYAAVDGFLEVGDPRGGVPSRAAAIAVDESSLEGPRGSRRVMLRSGGSPFVGIDLRFARDRVAVPLPPEGQRLEIDDAAADAVRSLARRKAPGEAEGQLSVVLAWLDRQGIVASPPAPPIPRSVDRLWSAVRPLVEKLAVLPSLDELSAASGLSLRQLTRDVDVMSAALGLGDGWRPLTRRMRLKLAALALSCEDATVAEVAKIVGYSSADAMGRALRDAGLPAPSEIRRMAVMGFP